MTKEEFTQTVYASVATAGFFLVVVLVCMSLFLKRAVRRQKKENGKTVD